MNKSELRKIRKIQNRQDRDHAESLHMNVKQFRFFKEEESIRFRRGRGEKEPEKIFSNKA